MKKSVLPVGLFVVIGVMVLMAEKRALEPVPDTVGQVITVAQRLNLYIRLARKVSADFEDGAFLCTRVRTWDELNALRRNVYSPAWAGVVSVQTGTTSAKDWREGPCCKTLGSVVLFGDPDLLRRVRRLFRER